MIKSKNQNLMLFFAVIATFSIAIGFSEGLFANYFKEVYNIDGYLRGLIEFPRELPGILCFFIVGAVAFLGDITLAIIAQALAATGLFILGFFTPSFNYMLIFLFINSMGLHLYMPLRDSIGMALSEPDKVGKRMGQIGGVRFAFLTLTYIVVLVLFRTGIFSFNHDIKWTFIISAIFYIMTMVLLIKLKRNVGQVRGKRGRFRFVFRWRYKYYYLLAIVFGVQKQVMLVFGPWVLIELLGQKEDSMVLLYMIAGMIGMVFMPMLGRLIDKFGVKKLLYVDALSFIFVYLSYGILCHLFALNILATVGLSVILTASLFVVDRLSTQMGVIRVMYLKSIAETPDDITPTLSVGLGLDHIVSIIVAYLGGLAWITIGAQYIFYIVAALSIINLVVAIRVREPAKPVAES